MIPFRNILALACGVLAFMTAEAAAPAFRADKPYPAIGLRFRTLADSKPAPPSSPTVYPITYTRGEKQWTEDLCSVEELWRNAQTVGQWIDGSGNGFTLAKIEAGIPPSDFGVSLSLKGVPSRLIKRETFQESYRDLAVSAKLQPEEAAAWVERFTGLSVRTPNAVKAGFSVSAAYSVPLERTSQRRLAWLFRVKRPGGTPTPWFCAVIELAEGSQAEKAEKNFETQFLANLRAIPVSTPRQTGPTAAKTATPIPSSPSRDAARASIANMKGWWAADLKDYIILANIRSQAGNTLIRSLKTALPVLRENMKKLIPPYEENAEVNVVRIFESQEEYQSYVGKGIEWSCGCWVPMKRELVILASDRFKKEIVHTIQHEGFHQYLFYASSMIENAMWFNEGHACFYEGGKFRTGAKPVFEKTWRMRVLKESTIYAASRIPFVLEADHKAFYSGSDKDRSVNYAVAWGLVWYLRQGIKPGSPYATILKDYRDALRECKDPLAATRKAFEGIDLKTFQKDFANYWKKQ